MFCRCCGRAGQGGNTLGHHGAVIVDGQVQALLTGSAIGQLHRWTPDEAEFVTGLANIAALAIERQLRRRVEQQDVDRAVSLSRKQLEVSELMQDPVIRSGALQDATRLLTRRLVEILEVDRGSIKILTPDHSAVASGLIYVAETQSFQQGALQSPSEILDLVRRIGNSNLKAVEDVRTDPLCQEFYDQVLQKNDIRSLIHLPISVNGDFAGCLNVSASGRTIKWQPEHLMLATMIGQVASLVAERLEKEKAEQRLIDRTERQVRHHATLQRTLRDPAILSSDAAATFRAITKSFSDEIGTDRAGLWLFAADTTSVEYAEVFLANSNVHQRPHFADDGNRPLSFL